MIENIFGNLRFDVLAGKRHLLIAFALGIATTLFAVLGGWVRSSAYQIEWSRFSLGDNALLLLGGLLPPDQNDRNSILFPAGWLLLWAACFVIPIVYTAKYSKGYFGINVMLKSRDRSTWLLSKCLWAILAVLAFWFAAMLSLAILTGMSSGDYSLTASQSIESINLPRNDRLIEGPYDLTTYLLSIPFISALLVLPFVVASILGNELFAFLAVLVCLLSSLLTTTGLIPGEHLMAVRTDCFLADGITPIQSEIYALSIAIASILIGTLSLRSKSMVGAEADYD